VNVVVLAGRVADRPFRPGNGERVVVKLDVDGENPSKSDRIELHCFGAVAERAMRLWQGDLIGVRGRIELRIWSEDGEEYDELRVVAHRVDVMVKGNTQRPAAREGGNWGNRDGGRDGARDNRPQRGPRDARDQRGGQWLAPHETLGEHRAPVTDHDGFDDDNHDGDHDHNDHNDDND
jgi:single-stranded DNA-binding protein